MPGESGEPERREEPSGTWLLPSGAPVDPAGKRSDLCTGVPLPSVCLGSLIVAAAGRALLPPGCPQVNGASCGFPHFPCGPLPKRPVQVRLAGGKGGTTPSDCRSKGHFLLDLASHHSAPGHALNIEKRIGALPAQWSRGSSAQPGPGGPHAWGSLRQQVALSSRNSAPLTAV
ncbi:hypothetical protein NDU88_001085 [Pleurodeles waltl]|uniref:Uncharacterized protein n=1 Tax=Pleurodeles waltl TaxID=8319 RepID=A0AAV7Q509_PLEWA|nr:hypothetical protein NDU88_001085 [Pleurodeles waltl]